MRKKLHLMSKEQGYFLPYVIFISMIVFSLMTTSILIYKNKIDATHTVLELIEVETLIQMTKATFLDEELYNDIEEGEIIYEYPNGEVILQYVQQTEELVELTMTIITVNEFEHVKVITIRV